MLKRFAAVAMLVAPWTADGAVPLVLPKASLVPGGVLVLPLEGDTSQIPVVTYDDRRVMVLRQDDHWVAVIGIPLSTPVGHASVRVRANGKPETEVPFEVLDKKYVTQSLKVAPSKVQRFITRTMRCWRVAATEPNVRSSHGAISGGGSISPSDTTT